MTPAEVDAFLRRHHTMALATHADLGRAVLAQRYGPDADPGRFPVSLPQLVAHRVGARIRVERTVSWDHRSRP